MRALSSLALVVLVLSAAAHDVAAKAEKPEKIRVAFGAWTGPGAGAFKSSLKPALGKGCVVVGRKSARVLIEGKVEAEGKGAVLHLTVKSTKTDEIVESRDFKSPHPNPSSGLGNKIGRALIEIAIRSPAE